MCPPCAPDGRLLGVGELLAYPLVAVHDGPDVRRPPLDPGRRDFAEGRFGLPFLAAVFYRRDWQYQGTVADNLHIGAGAGAGGPGDVPGSHAAAMLEDVQRLLDSTLSDEAHHAVADRRFPPVRRRRCRQRTRRHLRRRRAGLHAGTEPLTTGFTRVGTAHLAPPRPTRPLVALPPEAGVVAPQAGSVCGA